MEAPDGGPSIAFFIPLPDRLPLPDGYEVDHLVGFERLDHDWVDLLEEGYQESADQPAEVAPTGIKYRIHQVRYAGSDPVEEVTSLFVEAAKKGFAPLDGAMQRREPDLRTIVEALVPLARTNLETLGVEYCFEFAMAGIRDLQISYSILRSRPLRLVTRGTLPVLIPMRLIGDDADDEDKMHLFETGRRSVDPTPALEQMAATDVHSLIHIRNRRARSSVVYAGHDLLREAQTQFHREANYRAAAITIGIAGEVFATLVHMWLCWESQQLPSDVVKEFDHQSSHRSRVVSSLKDLLGGQWAADRGVIGDYLSGVVELRNRVAHQAYEPTRAETARALDAYLAFTEHVQNRLSSHPNLHRYPRTAVTMCGLTYLEGRGRLSKKLRSLLDSQDEPSWIMCFEQWRTLLDFESGRVSTRPGDTRNNRHLAMVRTDDGPREWLAVDSSTAHASRLEEAAVAELVRDDERWEEVESSSARRLRWYVPMPPLEHLTWHPLYMLSGEHPLFPPHTGVTA